MTPIEILARELLDERELSLARHLTLLLSDDKYDSGTFILGIIPIYFQRTGDRYQSLAPRGIYRSLYYIHNYGGLRNFEEKTRVFLNNLSGHIEGCLHQLTRTLPPTTASPSPFGSLVGRLRKTGVLTTGLADQLWAFNSAVNVPSKHFNAYMPTSRLDERTFSIEEAAYAFVMTRKLSIQLFALLTTRGAILQHGWPEFNNKWITWSPLINKQKGD